MYFQVEENTKKKTRHYLVWGCLLEHILMLRSLPSNTRLQPPLISSEHFLRAGILRKMGRNSASFGRGWCTDTVHSAQCTMHRHIAQCTVVSAPCTVHRHSTQCTHRCALIQTLQKRTKDENNQRKHKIVNKMEIKLIWDIPIPLQNLTELE